VDCLSTGLRDVCINLIGDLDEGTGSLSFMFHADCAALSWRVGCHYARVEGLCLEVRG
jgi:hypothetical protein